MSSIIFNGHDFGELTSAKVLEAGSIYVKPVVKRVPGRPGALLLGGDAAPKRFLVRLFLNPGFEPGTLGTADVRRRVEEWMFCPEGGELMLPDDGGLRYRDVICTGAGMWSSLHADAWCDFDLTAYDPIAYGREMVETGASFSVGGTWRTAPVIEIGTAACEAVAVACGDTAVQIAGPFEAGQAVIIDCGAETVTVDGEAADSSVALASDFFRLEPGDCTLEFTGAITHTVRYMERWL